MRIIVAVALFAFFALPLAAQGELETLVRTAADVNENARSGDHVVVQGHITEVTTGSGSRQVVRLEDDTGEVLIRVPEHLLRHLNEGNDPQVGGHVRVAGKWGHAYLDDEIWGIHAQDAERVEE
jgi:hypothetical protein